jgi:prepilin-type N-terminal cleavage/methylation domain-containing protein
VAKKSVLSVWSVAERSVLSVLSVAKRSVLSVAKTVFSVAPCTGCSGFTLIEVLVSVALLVLSAVGVAQLVGVATNSVRASREQTTTVLLAAAKMEQLRALDWTYVSAGGIAVERSDLSTNASSPSLSSGGVGLSASPSDTLSAGTAFYADYLDAHGRWVGSGAAPPIDAVFARRWAVQPLAADPSRTLVIQVLVTTVQHDRERRRPWTSRTGTEAALVSVLTRKR